MPSDTGFIDGPISPSASDIDLIKCVLDGLRNGQNMTRANLAFDWIVERWLKIEGDDFPQELHPWGMQLESGMIFDFEQRYTAQEYVDTNIEHGRPAYLVKYVDGEWVRA